METKLDTLDLVCRHHGTRNPQELHEYAVSFAEHMNQGNVFDYINPNLVNNELFKNVRALDHNKIGKNDLQWVNRIMWLWYHQAAQCALFKHKDVDQAKKFVAEALRYQDMIPDHPCRITRLFSLLLKRRVVDARAWINEVPQKWRTQEHQEAKKLMTLYAGGRFYPVARVAALANA